MKPNLLLVAIVALGVTSANAQKSSGGASAGSQGASAQPAAPATSQPSASDNRNQPTTGGQNQNQQQQSPPTIVTTTSDNSGSTSTTNQLGGGTNQFDGGTNQFGGATNQFGGTTNQFGSSTNQAGGTNQLTPTSSPGATNRLFGTNSTGRFGTNDMRNQDHAFTERDKAVLVRVREAVLPRIQVNGQTPPVHFSVSQGVVTLLGSVQTIQMRQEIEQIVIQSPGVVNIVDQLLVGGGGETTVSASDQQLLLRVRQAVLPQIQTSGAFAPAVDFSVNQGVVTVMGLLPTPEESQRIVALVRQVPGVVQVTDQVRVNQPGTATPTAPQPQGTPRR
jgi:osmotically-inducible protein OsmY